MDTSLSQWDPAYSVGIPEIDKQHQDLFSLAAQFRDEMSKDAVNRETISRTLHQLREYAESHFSTEEQIFKNHPQFSFHRQIHRAFILKITQLEQDYQDWKVDLATDIFDFILHWLVTHITETDRNFLSPDKKARE